MLRYIKSKLLNYFISAYINNSRLNNSTNSLLKIFWEKNTKQVRFISSLGNVFRNSKWSDFKVQNVKQIFYNQYLLILCVLILGLCSVITFDSNYVYCIMWFSVSNFYESMIDIFLYTSLLSYSFLYILLDTIFIKPKPTFITKKNISSTYFGDFISKDNQFIGNDFDLIIKLYSLKMNLDLLDNIETKYILKDTIVFNDLDISNLYLLKTNSIYSKDIPLTNTMLSLNPKELSGLDLSLIGLKDTLDISKQERFIVKNSYMDVNMIYNNQNYVSLKKLLGNGITDVDAKNNIWLSNKFTGNKHNLQALMNIESSTYLTNFNFFEEGREFLMKRSNFFTNQQYNILSKNLIPRKNSHDVKGIWTNETMNQLYTINISQYNMKFISLMPIDINNDGSMNTYYKPTSYTLDVPHDIILDPYTLDLVTNLDAKTINLNSWL